MAYRRSAPSLFWSTLVVAAAVALPGAIHAQQAGAIAAEGYITAVRPPDSFDVDGEHVTLKQDTLYGFIDKKITSSTIPLPQAVQVGAYVQVVGDYEHRRKTTSANLILFRGDWDKELEGMGVIDRVIAAGGEPIFEADGYRIRIASTTKTSFRGNLKSLADVGTNIWLRYRGKRDQDGVLDPRTADFIPAKPTEFKKLKGVETVNWNFQPPRFELKNGIDPAKNSVPPYDASDQETVLTQDGHVTLGEHTRRIPANQELQSRVRRVGMRVVPGFQKELPASDPSKIQFRFYAVEEEKVRSEICGLDGLILVPRQVVERLKTDDQLAAVLADGVAYNLQRDAARLTQDKRLFAGAEAAGLVASVFAPGLNIAEGFGAMTAASKIQTAMQEQRGRVALSLMAEGGFDPWQAPEAWKLLGPKHLPSDMKKLKYPSLSGYQLEILNLQYRSSEASLQNTGVVPR
jgi:hypothetical protein